MAFENAIKELDGLFTAMAEAAFLAGNSIVAKQVKRVHTFGKAADGSLIGPGYSTKPYFTSLERFVARGSIPEENISANNKWVQLPEGYKSFREYSSRQTNFVDLRYTSHLEKSYVIRKTENGFVAGYIGSADESGITAGAKMAIAEEYTYKKSIIGPSADEIQEFKNLFIQELRLRLAG